jgi:hypothetical protein
MRLGSSAGIIGERDESLEQGRNPMSIFPATILLATDGSEEAQLAATTATDLAQKTNSELHVLTVGPDYPLYELPEHPAGFEDVLRENRREAKEMLEQQVKRIEESGGTGRGDRRWVDSDGQQGPRQAKEGFVGQCLGCGCQVRPLPSHHSQAVRDCAASENSVKRKLDF